MDTKDNRRIWDMVCKTDPKFTTKVSARGGFTAIDAYWQIEQATALWGPYGSTWGLRGIIYSYIHSDFLCVVQAKFWYPDGEFEIGNAIRYKEQVKGIDKVDEDFIKKVETSTISKALSRLGFSADVFEGRFDDNQYVTKMNEEFGNPLPQKPVVPGIAGVTMPPGQLPSSPTGSNQLPPKPVKKG